MTHQGRMKEIMITAIVLFGGTLVLCAQELPPPPPGGLGGDMFFARFDGGPGGKLVKGAPYSAQAITETSQTLGDGNQIHRTATSTLYRDSEGRTRREETMGALGPWSVPQTDSKQVVMINDPVAGVHYMLDPVAHTAHKMPAFQGKAVTLAIQKMTAEAEASAAPLDGASVVVTERVVSADARQFETKLDAEGGALHVDTLGTQVIEGVPADGTRTTATIAAGKIGNALPIQIVTEQWYSSALQTVVMSKRNDPRVGETVYRLTNISQAEPAAALFQVPSDYTIQEGHMRQPHYEPKLNTNP